MGWSVPRWVPGSGPLGVPPCCSANASLGVFDKLTLCTLSVELSLSNTRSAALQLSVGVAEVFSGCYPECSTLDSNPMAAHAPDIQGEGTGVSDKPSSTVLKPSGQQEKELKSVIAPRWDTVSPW